MIKEQDSISPIISQELHFNNHIQQTTMGGIITTSLRLFMFVFVIGNLINVINREDPYISTTHKILYKTYKENIDKITDKD